MPFPFRIDQRCGEGLGLCSVGETGTVMLCPNMYLTLNWRYWRCLRFLFLRITEREGGELGESFAVGCDCDNAFPPFANSLLPPGLLELCAPPMSTAANQKCELQTGKKTEKDDDHNEHSLHPELRLWHSDISHHCNNWAPSSIRLGTTLHCNLKISTLSGPLTTDMHMYDTKQPV